MATRQDSNFGVHILSLPQLQNRLRVKRQWLWSYFTGQRRSCLIPESF
jgi:NADH dehydrogenase